MNNTANTLLQALDKGKFDPNLLLVIADAFEDEGFDRIGEKFRWINAEKKKPRRESAWGRWMWTWHERHWSSPAKAHKVDFAWFHYLTRDVNGRNLPHIVGFKSKSLAYIALADAMLREENNRKGR